MAVQSQQTVLGASLPDLTLPDLSGTPVTLNDYRDGTPLLVAFVCNHCPYVRHVETLLGRVADQAMGRGVKVVAIMSNDTATHPTDGPDGMAAQAQRAGWHFPYLLDADQHAALTLGAACTPDFFLYDAAGALAYRGAFDTSSPKNGQPLDGSLLRDAIDHVLAGRPVPLPHRPALGCGIKWLPGNEPEAISFA